MIPVLMSGGSGTRLWPVSRTQMPKQFCPLFGESLQAMTLKRLAPFGAPWIVTSEILKDLTLANLRESGVTGGDILFEPRGRNTAAAIAFVCRVLELQGKMQEIVGIFPADHLVTKNEAFQNSLQVAEKLAQQKKVVTLGIHPSHPETGFGYIQIEGKALHEEEGVEAYQVARFHEKPALETAKQFVADGRYSWNAGIFIFEVAHMIELLKKHEPDVWNPISTLKQDLSNLNEVYDRVKSISIDYAVMEKIGGTGELLCLPVQIGWSDVGSWDAVAEEAGTRLVAQVDVHRVESEGSFVSAPAGKKVAIIGLPGVRVVDTPDALLISAAGQSQKVRQVVESLSQTKDPVLDRHSLGAIVTGSSRCQVHQVMAGQSWKPTLESCKGLRHWTITQGKAEITCEGRQQTIQAGGHLQWSTGQQPDVRNVGEEALELIEVQLTSL